MRILFFSMYTLLSVVLGSCGEDPCCGSEPDAKNYVVIEFVSGPFAGEEVNATAGVNIVQNLQSIGYNSNYVTAVDRSNAEVVQMRIGHENARSEGTYSL